MKTNFARKLVRMTGVCGVAAMIAVPLAPSVSIAAATNVATAFETLVDSDILALGPVEHVDVAKRQLQVLGQLIVVPVAQSAVLDSLLGKMVEVHGSVKPDGTLHATKVSEITTASFVPGATQLYLRGAISSVDQVNAVARVGSLSIKYAGALHTLSANSLAVGQLASFSGVEYFGIAAFYADNGRVTGSVATISQEGSDKVGASGQISQEGSDKVGPSSLKSQEGSDKVSPSSLKSQEGSDKVSPASLKSQEGATRSVPRA